MAVTINTQLGKRKPVEKYLLVDNTDKYTKSVGTVGGDRITVSFTIYSTLNTIFNNPDDFIFTTPANSDASVSYDGVGAGIQLIVTDEEENIQYQDNIPWPTLSSLKTNGIVSYDSITDEITFNLAEALSITSASYYGFPNMIPEDDFDKTMRILVSFSIGSSFTTNTEQASIDLYNNYSDLNLASYSLVETLRYKKLIDPNKLKINTQFGIDPK